MNLMKFFEKNMCLILSFVLVCIISVSLGNSGMLPENFENDDKSPTCCLFHADWCPHCVKLMPIWKELKEKHGDKCNFVEVEAKEKNVMKNHDINGYPTIKFLPNGLSTPEGSKEYKGERDIDSLAKFVDENTTENFKEYIEGKVDNDSDDESDDEFEENKSLQDDRNNNLSSIDGFDGKW